MSAQANNDVSRGGWSAVYVVLQLQPAMGKVSQQKLSLGSEIQVWCGRLHAVHTSWPDKASIQAGVYVVPLLHRCTGKSTYGSVCQRDTVLNAAARSRQSL